MTISARKKDIGPTPVGDSKWYFADYQFKNACTAIDGTGYLGESDIEDVIYSLGGNVSFNYVE